MGVRETICSNCKHLKVCKFKDGFLKLVESTDKITDKHDVHTIRISCSEYDKNQELGIIKQ